MEFPGTIITKPVRMGILVFFILLFFTLTPLIILYTTGYRYDFSRKAIMSTGAINIDIEPKNAAVYIDGVKQSDQMPLRLKDKMPGKYLVDITAPGYFDWQKIVEVKSKQTVYIKDISMIRKNEPSLIISAETELFSLSETHKYIAYIIKDEKKQKIFIKNLETNQETPILSLNTEKKLDFSWAKKNNYFVVYDSEIPHNILHILNADEPAKDIDLIKKIRYPVTKFSWRNSLEPEFYYSTGLKIISLLPDTEQRLVLTDDVYKDWYMEGDKMWAIEKNTTTNKISILEDILGFKRVFANEDEFDENENDLSIMAAENEQILLKKNNEAEMILLTSGKKFNISGEKFLISDFNNWWLIWTPWEIWTYNEGGEPMLLNRTGQQLKKIVPLDRYNTLALNWAQKTTALFPYYLVTHDLLEQPSTDLFADTDKRVLYFGAEINSQKGIWQMGY